MKQQPEARIGSDAKVAMSEMLPHQQPTAESF